MAQPQVRYVALLACVLLLASAQQGCAPSKLGRGTLSTRAALFTSAEAPLLAAITGHVTAPAAGVISSNTGNLIANNAAGLIANNSAGIITNNAAGIITNNAAGIITNNAAGYKAAGPAYHLAEQNPAAGEAQRVIGAMVEVLDETGRVVSKQPITTDASGAFRFAPEDLLPGGLLRVVRASATIEGKPATFYSVLSTRAAGQEELALNAANTLVGKKVLYRLRVKTLRAEDFTGGSTDDFGEACSDYLSDQAEALALLGEPDVVAQAFDLIVAAVPALDETLREVAREAGGSEVLADGPAPPAGPSAEPTAPEASAAAPEPAPTDGGTGGIGLAGGSSGGSSGGGGSGGSVVTTSTAAITVSTAGRYSLVRAAGNDAGGNAAGTSPTTAALRAVAGVALAADGTLYLADPVNHQIRRVPVGGGAELLAGSPDGTAGSLDHVTASAATLDTPCGLLLDETAGALLVADAGNKRVRRLRLGGRVDAFAGGGSTTTSPTTATALQLDEPVALAADANGRTYVADRAGGRVWRLDADRSATLVASVAGASALALDPGRDLLWIGTSTGDVRVVTAASTAPALAAGAITIATGTPACNGLACDQRGGLYALLEATSGAGAQVWYLPYDATGGLQAGRAAERIAGTGTQGADAAAYSAPTSALSDAKTGRLNGRFPGALAIDLSAAASAATLSGQLYVGSSYANELTRGQVVRLDPVE